MQQPHQLLVNLCPRSFQQEIAKFIVCILSTAFVSALETKKFNLFIELIIKPLLLC